MGYASKVPQHQQMYLQMLTLGLDRSSHLYRDGKQRCGAGHLGAFWDGYNGVKNSGHVLPSTLSEACAAAGAELRSRDEVAGTVVAEGVPEGEPPCSKAPAAIVKPTIQRRQRGRTKLAANEVRCHVIRIRSNQGEAEKFKSLGGNDWFRRMLRSA